MFIICSIIFFSIKLLSTFKDYFNIQSSILVVMVFYSLDRIFILFFLFLTKQKRKALFHNPFNILKHSPKYNQSCFTCLKTS